MFRRGFRLFSTASIALILVALLHQFGHVGPPPADPARQRALEAMEAYRLPLPLGMRPPLRAVMGALSVTMTVTFIALAIQNLAVAAADGPDRRMMRRLALSSALTVGALVAVFAHHRISPPLLLLPAIGVMFLLAYVLPGRDRGGTG
jgi:hypothetical protein